MKPDCPTFDISTWNAIWAPKNTPRDIIAKLNAAVVDALAVPTVRSRLGDLGQEIPTRDQLTPEVLGALQRAEVEKCPPSALMRQIGWVEEGRISGSS
jgi:tripartite-type tricarboxylate transporter receptor subunit TctC